MASPEWTQREDMMLLAKHVQYGNSWRWYLQLFPGRTKGAIRARWWRLTHPGQKRRRSAEEEDDFYDFSFMDDF
jgi:hypothetical protein